MVLREESLKHKHSLEQTSTKTWEGAGRDAGWQCWSVVVPGVVLEAVVGSKRGKSSS